MGDPDRIKSYGSALVWQNPFTIYTFIDGPAQYYGIFSYKGYSVRTDVLTVRELACDHPGVDADNRCSQCRAEVAASVELNGSTGYYLSLSEALALARTDAYRGCTLTILRSSTDPISVNSGTFTLTAAQDVTLGGKVTLGKKANVTLSGGSYTSARSRRAMAASAPPFWRRAMPIPTAASSTAMSPSSVAWTWSPTPSTSTSG